MLVNRNTTLLFLCIQNKVLFTRGKWKFPVQRIKYLTDDVWTTSVLCVQLGHNVRLI